MKRILFIVTALTLSGVSVFSQTNQEALENLAAQIAEKRSQVEALSNQLDLQKAEYNERLRSIATQQADVETRIKREELNMAKLERDMEEYSARIMDNRTSMREIKPIIMNVLDEMRSYISTALPFQTDSRLAELDSLERLLDEGRLDEASILARIWNTLEAEFRLARESGLYRQTITLNGEQQLAEVARLGMAIMYFKTFDEKFGYVVPAGSGWEYRIASSRDEQKQIEVLFDALRKNLREGYFVLPNPDAKG